MSMQDMLRDLLVAWGDHIPRRLGPWAGLHCPKWEGAWEQGSLLHLRSGLPQAPLPWEEAPPPPTGPQPGGEARLREPHSETLPLKSHPSMPPVQEDI